MSDSEAVQVDNEWSNKYFAISMGAIMLLAGIFHWIGIFCHHYGPRKSRLPRLYKQIHRFWTDSVFRFLNGHYLIYSVYWSINLVLCLCDLDLTNLGYVCPFDGTFLLLHDPLLTMSSKVAKRFGWISIANLVLLVFLALRNTPLAPLTAKSYEKLRPLHKVAGYTCIVTSCIHGIMYLTALSQYKALYAMKETQNFTGAIAGASMIIIGFSTITFFMRKYYELFYMLHILMFILIMITVGMHRPKLSTSSLIVVVFVGSLWTLDRIIRSAKMAWNFLGNHAIITPLPNNAVKVKLSRSLRSSPGSHVFLWIPAIRWLESHPFTLLSSNPAEFVVRAYDGFTQDLYNAACNAPGMSFRCSIDGAYGQIPNFKSFDRAVLLAGGSGASFTFAIALDLVKTAQKSVRAIDFIWVVRHKECIEWFSPEIEILQCHPSVNLQIYVTRVDEDSDVSTFAPSLSNMDPMSKEPAFYSVADPEKGTSKVPTCSAVGVVGCNIGRPDINDVIATALLSGNTEDDKVIVGACGPSGLLNQTRNAVHIASNDEGPSVKLYTEEFKW